MTTGAVEKLRAAIDDLAAADLRGVSQRDDLAALWREMARLDAQFARRIDEFDHSSEWSVDGARSAAGWLVAKARAASGDAHHRVNVARRASRMPIAAVAWQEGAVSSRHVDAMASIRRKASADAEFAVFEPALVEVARTGRPEDVVELGRQWLDALDDHLNRDRKKRQCNRQHERRNVDFSQTLDGVGILDGRFDAEGAEIVGTAIRRRYEQAHAAGDVRSPGQQRADALVEICRRDLDQQPRGANRPHIVVTVDAETLAGEAVGRCETSSGYRLSPDTLRRLACDAIVQRIVVSSDGVLLDMGRASRTFTPDQYRAIMLRDGGCRFPGCDARPDQCEAHHALIHWEDGGDTNLANGLAVCRGPGHHRLVHEGGWTLRGDPDGEVSFFDPDGNCYGTTPPRNAPPPMPTRMGNEIADARRRLDDLQRHRPAAVDPATLVA